MEKKLLIKKLHPDAIVPHYSRNGDIGLDVYSIEDIEIPSLERVVASTGIAIVLPAGYAGLIWDRGGMAAKNGIKTMGGVFDPNYRGDWGIILFNTTQQPYSVKKGDRIAQILVQKIDTLPIEEVSVLPESNREHNRFGSSGR